MRKGMFLKLAATNLKNNRSIYIPYMLTGIGTICMFYIMSAVADADGLENMRGGAVLVTMLTMGVAIIGIFSLIFLFYSNSFLMKRRKKEIGLYNILGLEKRHIGRVMFYETVMTYCICLAAGLGLGILLSQLIFLVLLKILNYSVVFTIGLSVSSMVNTACLFGVIFGLTLLYNWVGIYRISPLNIMQEAKAGEREPKNKVLVTLTGLLLMGWAYWAAITVENPLTALNLFFIAVLAVIMATHLLFSAGSITFFKFLKTRKNYYYQAKHFTTVSGMIYRMKQNAAGLANICILSTMVIISISTTVSLYFGMNNLLETRYPYDISIDLTSNGSDERQAFTQYVEDILETCGLEAKDLSSITQLRLVVLENEGVFSTDGFSNLSDISLVSVIPQEEYTRITGRKADLGDQEMLVFVSEGGTYLDSYDLFGTSYSIKERLDDFPGYEAEEQESYKSFFGIVVKDLNVMEQIRAGYYAGREQINGTVYNMSFNLDADPEVKKAVANQIIEGSGQFSSSLYLECRESNREDFASLYGGFFFLGIFLGFLFLMATVLIIYYKQISEAYDDRERFEIMQKVGMSHREVKNAIRSQVLTIFFLPLVMAVVHVLAAFNMMKRLLYIFNLSNISLFVGCTAVTILVFAIIYALVYSATSKVYYRIVMR